MATSTDALNESTIITHEELLKITSSVLNELLSKDAYLSDLPSNVTVEEINNQIALLHGKSITVNVVRGNEIMPVIIPQASTRVYELKRAIKRSVNLLLTRSKSPDKKYKKTISWRYIWRTYNLANEEYGIMENNDALVESYGVKHKSYITFVKRKRKKSV